MRMNEKGEEASAKAFTASRPFSALSYSSLSFRQSAVRSCFTMIMH